MTTRNDSRAKPAQAALQSYVEAKGEVFENGSGEVAELMAGLLHPAARTIHGEDGAELVIGLARTHFDAEHNNPEEESR
jgi:hypothetical protein